MRSPCQSKDSTSPAFVVICLLLASFLLPACSSPPLTVTVPRIERFTVRDPAASARDIDRALSQRADAYAASIPGARAWRGLGLSMEPLIPPDAWIVTEPIPYAELQRGQVVLYRGPDGRFIAHALAKPTRHGWIAVGVNNAGRADPTPITARNYLGVVTAAFTATPAKPGVVQ